MLPWTPGSPSGCWQSLGSKLLPTAGSPLKPFPLDAHPYTGGAEVPVLPWPLRGTGGTEPLPQKQGPLPGEAELSEKLTQHFPLPETTELEVTLDAPAEQTENRAATCPQLLPALCPACLGHQQGKSQLRGPMASAAIGAAAPAAHRDSPTPPAGAGSRAGRFGTFKSASARVFFCFPAGTKVLPSCRHLQALVFPALRLLTEGSNSRTD